ncbi:GNAT family N-acetyltransferase [Pseudoduganella sp. DS3]|uniref:GNAT family N-acetyltransferase n=1 Tax=Pseudoduganella guangdongensis TaxID=2692179 RepID=A0A6N9HBE2_9BURK|nr:GNAT family N-acetyltransferase [Pseudoduganella guangdongensis]MYN00814.1 GNAT family N-acetyltransferase [Pseudoduganella guangdongensis]
MSNLIIRPARPDDVAAIMAMIRELAVFEKLEHLVVADEAMLLEEMFGSKPGVEGIVGEEAGEVVSYALFFHNFSTFLCKKGLYLEDLYVKQDRRGAGFGKQMLAALAKIAVERECGRFEWSVLDWNVNAIKFYEQMGADVLPDWRVCRVTGPALQALADA